MTKNILIIDDNKEILEIAKQLLELNGYTVFTFDYFKIALKFYKQRHHEITLILLDMELVDATYIDTIPALSAINPDIPIIGMTGGLIKNKHRNNYQKYLSAFIEKPFCGDTLLSEISLCAAK